MLTMPIEELEAAALEIAKEIGEPEGAAVEVREDFSEVGSGAYPAHQIPTHVVSVRHREIPAAEIAYRMRMRPYAVFARVKDDALLIDPRTVQADELSETAAAVREALEAGHGG
jgi:L-seryl-tRNA(Ser) seleniumtransferase